MSGNIGSSGPMQPLSAGNVVSAAVLLYRSHLKTYFKQAVLAHLWVLIPIYGWAKYAAISGLISRLAFSELIYQPETVADASSHINQRLWSFLRIAFQVALSLLGVYILLAIAGGIMSFFIGMIFVFALGNNAAFIAPIVIAIIMGCFLFLGLTWCYSRWVIAEVPLAVEENINGGESVARSWDLTKTSVFRIQGVVLVAFLVTIPIVGLLNYLPSIFLARLEPDSTIYWVVYFISVITSLIGGVLVMPFWQALKAVLYLDLRNRREGMGLDLREPPQDFRSY